MADVDVEELCASSKVARSGDWWSGNGSLKDLPVDVILETYIEEESKGPAAAWKVPRLLTDTASIPSALPSFQIDLCWREETRIQGASPLIQSIESSQSLNGGEGGGSHLAANRQGTGLLVAAMLSGQAR